MPGRSRGGGQADKLVIPPSAVLVQLQLDLATASQPSYRAFLNNGQGSEIWSQAELKAKVTADGQVVVISLPASLLTPDTYLLKLKGVATNGDLENAGSCQFQVLNK